jgi:hypothetical protein
MAKAVNYCFFLVKNNFFYIYQSGANEGEGASIQSKNVGHKKKKDF